MEVLEAGLNGLLVLEDQRAQASTQEQMCSGQDWSMAGKHTCAHRSSRAREGRCMLPTLRQLPSPAFASFSPRTILRCATGTMARRTCLKNIARSPHYPGTAERPRVSPTPAAEDHNLSFFVLRVHLRATFAECSVRFSAHELCQRVCLARPYQPAQSARAIRHRVRSLLPHLMLQSNGCLAPGQARSRKKSKLVCTGQFKNPFPPIRGR